MLYRRFGRTELGIPVFSCGGMRYQQSWKSDDPFTDENQKNLEATILKSVEIGINHIETARGYGTSEKQLGLVLPKLPRDQIIIQTKVSPFAETEKFHKTFDQSMSYLQLDYVDLFAIHGINNQDCLEWSLREGGCLDEAIKLKKQGRVRHIGFSTHGATDIIVNAIQDGRFDYVNLHWYYVNRFNWRAVEEARKLDMGVFIISPNDKGGKLYDPPEKLVSLTAPLSPMVFNDLWCLSRKEIHTLSLGASRPSDFDEHLKALPYLENESQLKETIEPIEKRLREELINTFDEDWVDTWHVGIPPWEEVPGNINILEILRLYIFAKAFDLIEFGKMRYNLLENGGHWFPGKQSGEGKDLDFSECLANSPHKDKIPGILEEAHQLLKADKVKRLSQQ